MGSNNYKRADEYGGAQYLALFGHICWNTRR